MPVTGELRVIVNVRLKNDHRSHDLQVPATMCVADLSYHIGRALRWPDDMAYDVFIEPGGERLPDHRTLAELDIWDGSHLSFALSDRPHAQRAALAAYLSSPTGQRYSLVLAHYHIGRRSATNPADPVPLIDLSSEPRGKTVSRRHADLLCEADVWVLRHLEPQNVTYVNGVAVPARQTCALSDGDHLQFGATELYFSQGCTDT